MESSHQTFSLCKERRTSCSPWIPSNQVPRFHFCHADQRFRTYLGNLILWSKDFNMLELHDYQYCFELLRANSSCLPWLYTWEVHRVPNLTQSACNFQHPMMLKLNSFWLISYGRISFSWLCCLEIVQTKIAYHALSKRRQYWSHQSLAFLAQSSSCVCCWYLFPEDLA